MKATVSCFVVSLFCALPGCSGGSSTTSGKRVTLHTVVAADPEVQSEFATSVGWNVTLASAAVSIGALYYFDGAPAFVQLRAPRPSPLDRFEQLLGIGIAYAHPGHYEAGDAMGQMLVPDSFDLLSGSMPLADGMGVSGVYRSGRFVIGMTNVGASAAELGEHAAIAAGKASKGAKTVYFRLAADFADIVKNIKDGAVDGCAFDETDVEADGTVTVTIKPSVWLSLVDFTDVAPGTPSTPTDIAAGETAQVGFLLGVRQLSAYHFSYAK